MIEFRISDTFTDSLAKLSNDEQKSVKNDSIRFADESTNSALQRFHTVINPVMEPAESKALASGGADIWNILRMKYGRSLIPLARFLMRPIATFPASTRALEMGCLA